MKISSNSINRRSSISTNLSNKEKHPSMTKLQDQHITTTIPSMSIALILMVVGLYKIEKRTLGHLHKKKGVRGLSTIEQTSTTKGAMPGQGHGHG
jgi:flagellar biogenesis protein FliO